MLASHQETVDVGQCTKTALDQSVIMVVHSLPEGWLPVSIAPTGVDLEVGVMDKREVYALVFPVRKSGNDWVDASTAKRIDIQPTHWRKWIDGRQN